MIKSAWQNERTFLTIATIITALCFSAWGALLNNFAIEQVNFGGSEIGLLQSLREIPGFLAFTAIFLLLVMSEQTLVLVALCLLSIGVAITGLFPFEYGLYATTVLMSIGFHYFETVNNSLTLQWIHKDKTPSFLGKMISIKSLTSLATYGAIWLAVSLLAWQFSTIYLVFGILGLVLVILLVLAMPKFNNKVSQHKKLIVRKKYWLYYLLVFLSGARRQIFVVFAGFMMVEKFGYDASDMALLFIANHLASLYFAPKLGRLIERIGEKRTLTFEYVGLILVFSGYALVENQYIASGLYVIDHLFFAMAIALKTYFQKIADPKDIAATSGVSFTINHIAAVVIPAFFGIIWLTNPSLVFMVGAAVAVCSLVLTQLIKLPSPEPQPLAN
jgi:predicted MFS family arabinose efflux permease